MALAPSFATHRIGSPSSLHTLELYLDLICPFSQKQLTGVRQHLMPLIESNKAVRDNLSIIIRQTPQPWHASSTLVHEAVLGVSKVLADGGDVTSYGKPEVVQPFQKYFFALMDAQKGFYDEPTAGESPNATRGRLADLAVQTVGIDRAKFLEAISVGKGNAGSPVTSDLKLQIKMGRQNGVHVTPTVLLDGLIDPSISSSFSGDDWKKYLEEKILPSGSKL